MSVSANPAVKAEKQELKTELFGFSLKQVPWFAWTVDFLPGHSEPASDWKGTAEKVGKLVVIILTGFVTIPLIALAFDGLSQAWTWAKSSGTEEAEQGKEKEKVDTDTANKVNNSKETSEADKADSPEATKKAKAEESAKKQDSAKKKTYWFVNGWF